MEVVTLKSTVWRWNSEEIVWKRVSSMLHFLVKLGGQSMLRLNMTLGAGAGV